MAKLIKADGSVIEVEPKNGTDFSLDELQAFVGGWIEVARLGADRIMVMNEEGKLIGLPINEAATAEYFRVTHRRDVVVGDALICKNEQVQ